MKYVALVGFILLVSGCSHFRINAAMCDGIQNDPNANPAMIQECRNYDEKEAEKASFPQNETQNKESFDKEIKEERK